MKNAKDLFKKSVTAAQKSAKEFGGNIAPKIKKGVTEAAETVEKTAVEGGKVIASTGKNVKDTVMQQLDVNHDGTIDIEDIIILAFKTPGIKVNREKFLQKEFSLHYDEDIVQKAIEYAPLQAGIPASDIDEFSDAVIQRERYCVSGISAALGAPGGAAMLAAVPTDIVQYYAYMLRTAQKLMYLYGFPQIMIDEEGAVLDSATINTLIISLGVMFGVAGTNGAICAMAKALGTGVEKQLMNKALTKGAIFPIVKGVTKWFGINLTKSIYTKTIGSAIPAIGSIISGGITYATFKPCCNRLRDSLKDTKLSNIKHQESKEEQEIYNAIVTAVYEETDT